MSTAGNERGPDAPLPRPLPGSRGPAAAALAAAGQSADRPRPGGGRPDRRPGVPALHLRGRLPLPGGRLTRPGVQPEQGLLVRVRHRAARDGARSPRRRRASRRTPTGPRDTSSPSPARSTRARTRSSATSSPSACSACRRDAADALPPRRRAAGVRRLAGRDADGRGHSLGRTGVEPRRARERPRAVVAASPRRACSRWRFPRRTSGLGAAARRTRRRLRRVGAARRARPAGGDGRGGGAAPRTGRPGPGQTPPARAGLRRVDGDASAPAGDVRPVAAPGTLPHRLKGVGRAPSRRAGRKPRYVQYEDFPPARREHPPDAAP